MVTLLSANKMTDINNNVENDSSPVVFYYPKHLLLSLQNRKQKKKLLLSFSDLHERLNGSFTFELSFTHTLPIIKIHFLIIYFMQQCIK